MSADREAVAPSATDDMVRTFIDECGSVFYMEVFVGHLSPADRHRLVRQGLEASVAFAARQFFAEHI